MSPYAEFFDAAERRLQSPATRLVLSFLIVLSVLPPGVLGLLPPGVAARVDLLFLLIFGPEFALRVSTFLRQWRTGRRNPWEVVLLGADFVALMSFLPLHGVFPNTAYFRLFRLTRLVLLLGYWGEMASDLGRILLGRERRYQVVAVVLFGLVLSFAGAVVLAEFAPDYGYDEDGVLTAADRGFRNVLWWSFRQVQDSGNLAVRPVDALVVLVSLALTFAGLVLFTFVIGISTGAMEELMHRARDRPVALRAHTVVLGFTASTPYLLRELAEIYSKNLKAVRGAVLGPSDEPPDAFFDRRLRGYEYRSGNPEHAADLERVGIADAKRVLVLGEGAEPDARVIATLLAARALTRRAVLYADLEHEKDFVAARGAGGPRTRVVGSGPFLGDYVAQNLAYPGIYHAYRQLLTATGCEIYTYLWDAAERRALAGLPPFPPSALASHAAEAHAVRWLGFLTAASPDAELEVDDLDVVLNPGASSPRRRFPYVLDESGRVRPATLRGLVGIAARFESLRALGRGLARGVSLPGEAAAGPGPSLSLPMGRPRRVLLCASGTQVPRVVSELMRYAPELTVTVLSRDVARAEGLVPAIAAAVENARSGMPDRRSDCRVEAREGGSLRVETAAGETGWVRVLPLDWTDIARIQRDPAVRLSETDAVAFLPRGDDESADGLVALDCLRIADLQARGALDVPARFHALGLLRDPVKADRLAARVADLGRDDGQGRRFTILSSERARYQFLVQNLFVPGLNAVLLEVLGASGQHLCRLLPSAQAGDPDRPLDPRALDASLSARGLLFVGIERARKGGGVEVLLDPREVEQGIPWEGVTALYALGDQRTVEAATSA